MTGSVYTSGEYARRHPDWHSEDSPWKTEQILKMIDRAHLKPDTVAEVGCGAGAILDNLHRELPAHVDLVGYEVSPDAFRLCQPRQKERLRFKLQDITMEGEPNFDLILLIDVIEHLEDYFTFLRSVRQKAHYKILHIPLDLSVQMVWREEPIRRVRRLVGHVHFFTKEIALDMLEDVGYEVIDHFYTAGSTDLSPRSSLTRLARWPRKILFKLNQDLAVRLLGGYSLLVLAR